MPVNNLESFVDSGPPTEADRAWFRIVRRVAEVGGIQRPQYTIQTSEREANGHGEVPFRPYSGELELILANLNAATREAILANIMLFENSEDLESATEFKVSSDSEDSDEADEEDEEEENGIQYSPSQVGDFMQNSSRVEMGTLGADDLSCSICKEEYGKQRRENSTGPASEIDPRLPDDEMPEYPVKLSGGHVLGKWCIKTWLLAQPASCPTSRRQFRPALGLIYRGNVADSGRAFKFGEGCGVLAGRHARGVCIYDNTVRLWDSSTGATLQTLEGHSDWVAAVVFSPDGKLVASASDDRTARLWDL